MYPTCNTLTRFRNYLATILRSTVYCISISGLSFAVHMSVFSAYCVFILLHCVSLCSVVFLYSLSATFCLPVLTSGPFFQCEALFLHLYLRRCPHFVEVLSSWCIKALSLFSISRLRPHILHCILRLHPHILYWGFVLIFYIEASSSLFYIEAMFLSFEALVLIIVGPCYFLCTASLVFFQWYVCGSVCLYFCLG